MAVAEGGIIFRTLIFNQMKKRYESLQIWYIFHLMYSLFSYVYDKLQCIYHKSDHTCIWYVALCLFSLSTHITLIYAAPETLGHLGTSLHNIGHFAMELLPRLGLQLHT